MQEEVRKMQQQVSDQYLADSISQELSQRIPHPSLALEATKALSPTTFDDIRPMICHCNIEESIIVKAFKAYIDQTNKINDMVLASMSGVPALLATLGVSIPASRQFDAVLGVDIHPLLAPPNTPTPALHAGLICDLTSLVGLVIGANTTFVGFFPKVSASAATIPFSAGHEGYIGSKFPNKAEQGEVFMGSRTVVADGEPMSYIGLPCLGCNVIGFPLPERFTKKGLKFSTTLYLPSSVIIPSSLNLLYLSFGRVLIGGTPTIRSLSGLIFQVLAGTIFGSISDRIQAKLDSLKLYFNTSGQITNTQTDIFASNYNLTQTSDFISEASSMLSVNYSQTTSSLNFGFSTTAIDSGTVIKFSDEVVSSSYTSLFIDEDSFTVIVNNSYARTTYLSILNQNSWDVSRTISKTFKGFVSNQNVEQICKKIIQEPLQSLWGNVASSYTNSVCDKCK